MKSQQVLLLLAFGMPSSTLASPFIDKIVGGIANVAKAVAGPLVGGLFGGGTESTPAPAPAPTPPAQIVQSVQALKRCADIPANRVPVNVPRDAQGNVIPYNSATPPPPSPPPSLPTPKPTRPDSSNRSIGKPKAPTKERKTVPEYSGTGKDKEDKKESKGNDNVVQTELLEAEELFSGGSTSVAICVNSLVVLLLFVV